VTDAVTLAHFMNETLLQQSGLNTKFGFEAEGFCLTFQKVMFYEPTSFDEESYSPKPKHDSTMTKTELVE